MKTLKKISLVVVAIILLGLLGCGAALDAITPCYIPPGTIAYAKAPPTTFLPFTTLWDSQRINRTVDYRFTLMQVEHGFIKEVMQLHQAASLELQTKVLQPAITGLVGSGAFAIGWLGLSKPSDKKKEAKV